MAGDPLVILRDDLEARELIFRAPRAVFLPRGAEEFRTVLETVESARRQGEWIAGYISYEAGYVLENKLAPLLPADRAVPLAAFGIFPPPRVREPEHAGTDPPPALKDFAPAWSREEYRKRFAVLHAHLRAGDCYQANLTFPIRGRWEGDPHTLFRTLAARQPVRYGALVRLGGPVVVSCSPELFFRADGKGRIETLPMKGTMPRGADEAQDAQAVEFLRNDMKNQAENRMIVDLLRNDISRIALPGTVGVPQLFHIETYPTVHQMVSRIRGQLLPGTGLPAILAALFPCGSVTGAPKIRAMEILHDLETSPRGVYCGAIGYAAPDGAMSFNVAIRTLTLFDDHAGILNVGSGVVFDSDADEEYDECLLKCRFALPGANLTAL